MIFEISLFWSFFFENLHFGQNLRKIHILVKIFEKSRIWTIFWKVSVDVKHSKNPDFGQNFREIAILVKIFLKSIDFGDDFRNTSILVKIFGNLIFGQILRKIAIWSKFMKISS